MHALTLLGDPWLRPARRPRRPVHDGYRPFTGLGVVAGDFAALLGLSFYARPRIGPRLWRSAPADAVVYVLALIHAMGREPTPLDVAADTAPGLGGPGRGAVRRPRVTAGRRRRTTATRAATARRAGATP